VDGGSGVRGGSDELRISFERSWGPAFIHDRACWVGGGIAVTMLVMLATARLDHSLDKIGAMSLAWVTLGVVTVPALVMWSNLLYRSTVIVWTFLLLVAAVGTFGYFWWPLTMVPFALFGMAAEGTSARRSVLWLGAGLAVGLCSVPLVALAARPAYGSTAIVCLAPSSDDSAAQMVLDSLFPPSWSRASHPAVSGVGTDTLGPDRRSVALIEFESTASSEDRQQEIDRARSASHVVAVVEVEDSPQRGGSRADPCP
jgi:hypothetical protein